jgi:hypothetical protein
MKLPIALLTMLAAGCSSSEPPATPEAVQELTVAEEAPKPPEPPPPPPPNPTPDPDPCPPCGMG